MPAQIKVAEWESVGYSFRLKMSIGEDGKPKLAEKKS
jgi:hypothetical protein